MTTLRKEQKPNFSIISVEKSIRNSISWKNTIYYLQKYIVSSHVCFSYYVHNGLKEILMEHYSYFHLLSILVFYSYAFWLESEHWPVYLPSISILILTLSILIFKYWYWYFLFRKCTEILILQYYFYGQYQYFSIFLNDLVTMFEATKIILMHFEAVWLNIGFIRALDCVFDSKTH